MCIIICAENLKLLFDLKWGKVIQALIDVYDSNFN